MSYDPNNPATPDRRGVSRDLFDQLERRVDTTEKEIVSIINSFPNKSIEEHQEVHKALIEEHLVRKEKVIEDAKLKKEIKAKIIKTIVQGAFMALMALLALGLQAQFSIWVNKVVDAPKATIEVNAHPPVKGKEK